MSAIALLLYRETAVISTVDVWRRLRSWSFANQVFEALLRQRGNEMRSRYLIHHPDRAHFVTSTIVEWLPVFTSPACCDILANSLEHCREHKHLKIYAWVILDNHFHAILAAPNLSAVLRDFKSFTAHEILQQLAEERREWLLDRLRYWRAVHKRTEHQAWQEGAHPQVITTIP